METLTLLANDEPFVRSRSRRSGSLTTQPPAGARQDGTKVSGFMSCAAGIPAGAGAFHTTVLVGMRNRCVLRIGRGVYSIMSTPPRPRRDCCGGGAAF